MSIPAKKSPIWLIVILIFSCVIILFLFSYNRTRPNGRNNSSNNNDNNKKNEKILTRDEFTRLIYLKTQDEVLKLIGKPVSTGGSNCLNKSPSECSSQWYYENKSYDPITGKVDIWIQVIFENNQVEQIRF